MNRLSVLVVTLVAIHASAQTAPEPAPSATPAPSTSSEPTGQPPPTATASGTTTTTNNGQTEQQASAGSAVLTPEQLASLSGFFFSFSLDHLVGMGTFVDPQTYAHLRANVNAFISYRTRIWGKAFSFGILPFGQLGFSYEYTLPDTDNGRRLTWTDARLSLSMPALFKEQNTGIVITPSFNIVVPTTIESWGAGLISRVGFGLSANKNFVTPVGKFILTLNGLGTIGIFTNPQSIVKPAEPDLAGHARVLCREGETVCGINGNNSFLALQGSFGATWAFTDWLFLSLSYGLLSSWNYAATDVVDEYTPKAVDANGKPVALTGMGRQNLQSASVSLSFNLTDAISGSLYMWNYAPLLTADQKSIRFPFVDVTGLPANNTTIGLSFSAVY